MFAGVLVLVETGTFGGVGIGGDLELGENWCGVTATGFLDRLLVLTEVSSIGGDRDPPLEFKVPLVFKTCGLKSAESRL